MAADLDHGCTWMDAGSVDDSLPKLGDVPRRDGLGESEDFGEAIRNTCRGTRDGPSVRSLAERRAEGGWQRRPEHEATG